MADRPPTNRNFSAPTGRKSNLIQIFIFSLLVIALSLLCSAIYLSRQLDLNSNHHDALSSSAQRVAGGRRGDKPTPDKNAAVIHRTKSIEHDKAAAMRPTNYYKKLQYTITKNNHDNSGNLNITQLRKVVGLNHPITDFSTFRQYPNDRLYCMIPFIWNPPTYNAIMATWGQRCDTIHFLTDAMVGGQFKGDEISFGTDHEIGKEDAVRPYWEYPPNTFPPNVKFINMTRSWENCESPNRKAAGKPQKVCRHIWEKMWRSWVYVEEHHLHDAEWFCKIDYDTFFFPDNFKYYVRDVKQWDPINDHHYFGHVIEHRSRKDRPMVVGASACWSQRTLKEIAQVYREMPKGSTKGERGKCEDRAHATEEVTTSTCLKDMLNVEPEAARDEQMREYITIDKYPLVLTWNRTEQGEWWFWRGKPQNAGQMENTIARRPIGIHKYKQPKEIVTLWEEFYGVKEGNNALEMVGRGRHGEVALKFVKEVRKAMGIDP